MLSRITPVLIISLIIFGSLQVTADEPSFDSNYSIVRPGENATISFQIDCYSIDKEYYNGSIDVPVPIIYTYFNNTSYPYNQLPIEEGTYKHLTCSAYDIVNITELMETFTVPRNIAFEDSLIFHIKYTFSPPKDEYNNDTQFFVQKIGDKVLYLGNITEETTGDDLWWLILILVPITIMVGLSLFQALESSRRRRRRDRDRTTLERECRQTMLRDLRRMGLDNNRRSYLSSSPTSIYEPKKSLQHSSPPTVFKCRSKNDGVREFVKGDGMFDIGIKKFKVPSFDEQVDMINDLPEVDSFNPTKLELVVNLNDYGKYFIKLKTSPTAYRVEDDETMSHRNPYIHTDDFRLCLGTGQKLYNRCYENKHYVECIRVLCKVLKSEHGSGYRKWSDCGM